MKCYHGAAMFWGDDVQPSWVKPPFIPGHEFLGSIVDMGENVKGFEVGDRITADQILPCGECKFCKSGKYWMCQPHNIFGFQNENNGDIAVISGAGTLGLGMVTYARMKAPQS